MAQLRYFVVGGAGFIGSHFTDKLLGDAAVAGVTLYDNFTSGREWHYAHHLHDGRLRVVRGDVKLKRGDITITTPEIEYFHNGRTLVAPEDVFMDGPRAQVEGKDLHIDLIGRKSR